MLKVFAIEFNSNLSVELWGEKRTSFKKGSVVVIGRDDRLKLLRLGCTQIAEKELEFKDVFKKEDIKDFAKIEEERRRANLPQEKVVEVAPEETKEVPVIETIAETAEVEEGTPESEEETVAETNVETDVETEESVETEAETAEEVAKTPVKKPKKGK